MSEINFDNFVTVLKRSSGGSLLPGTLRIRSTGVSISPDVTKNLLDENGQIVLCIMYSAADNAIRITSTSDTSEGFVFTLIGDKGGYASLNSIPRAFAALKIPRGEYKVHPKYPDIFILTSTESEEDSAADDPTVRYAQEPTPEVGDIVTWACSLREGNVRHPQFWVTGIIESIFDGDKGQTARINPLTQQYIDLKGNSKASIKVSNLIVREKKND